MTAQRFQAVALAVLATLIGVLGNNFPPVINPPPIKRQSVQVLDLQPKTIYPQDKVALNLPEAAEGIAEGGIAVAKTVDQRFFPGAYFSDQLLKENPTDTFNQYYPNGLQVIGPVATPRPDDGAEVYVDKGQPLLPRSVPEGSGYWVLANEQVKDFPAEQVPRPAFDLGTLKTYQPSILAKSSGLPVDPLGKTQQVWIQTPAAPPKGSPNVVTINEDLIPTRSQLSEFPTVSYKPIIAPEAAKGYPVAPVLGKLPPQSKTIVQTVEQIAIPNLPIGGVSSGGIPDHTGWLLNKDGSISEVRHIWVPTSPSSGTFITVPKDTVGDSPKLAAPKGSPQDVPQAIVSDTWVLKQDADFPLFERQQNPLFPTAAPTKAKTAVAQTPVILDASPVARPLIAKSIDSVAPYGIPWGMRTVYKSETQALLPPFPVNSEKSGSVVIAGEESQPRIPQQKVYLPPVPVNKVQITSPPAPQLVKNPCPKDPKTSVPQIKRIYFVPAGTALGGIRKPLLVRLSNVPNPLHTNSFIRPSLYAYGQPSVSKSGSFRFVPWRQISAIPSMATKSSARIVYPPLQFLSFLQNGYPWNRIRSYPVGGPNVFSFAPRITPQPQYPDSSSESQSDDASKFVKKSSESHETGEEEHEEHPEAEVQEEVIIEKEVEPEVVVEPVEEAEVLPQVEEAAESALNIQTAEGDPSVENEVHVTTAAPTLLQLIRANRVFPS